MNMKDMIQRMTDLESQAKQELTENVNECGDMPMNPPMDQGSPVSMNVNISASGKDHVADLVDMMKNAGLNTAAPVSQDMMPMRMDMEKFRGIVDKPETDGKLDLDIDGDHQPDFDTESSIKENQSVDPNEVKELLKKFDEKALEYRAYGMVDAATVVKALQQGNVDDAIEAVAYEYSGDDGEEPKRGFDNLLQDLEDEFKHMLGVGESVVGGNAKPEDPDSVFARLMSDISEIQNAAMDDNDMADDIADELGDYLRNGDAPKGSHYEKAIGIVMDAIHDGPQAQADAAEEAISFLHGAEEEARGNNEGYENEPDPDYRDHHHMTKDLSGGLNRQKKAYPAAQDGDNAMAAKIKEQLLAALSEKKMPMGPGPDGKKGTDDDKPAFLNQKTGAKKSKSDKKDGGMTDKQKKYFGKK